MQLHEQEDDLQKGEEKRQITSAEKREQEVLQHEDLVKIGEEQLRSYKNY